MSHHESHEGCCSHHKCCGHECSAHSHHHTCDCECHKHHHKYSDELLALADEAWMEVIKDEIKKEILKSAGDHISQLVSVVAKANHSRWMYKLEEKKNQEDYEDHLRNLMLRKNKP